MHDSNKTTLKLLTVYCICLLCYVEVTVVLHNDIQVTCNLYSIMQIIRLRLSTSRSLVALTDNRKSA